MQRQGGQATQEQDGARGVEEGGIPCPGESGLVHRSRDSDM